MNTHIAHELQQDSRTLEEKQVLIELSKSLSKAVEARKADKCGAEVEADFAKVKQSIEGIAKILLRIAAAETDGKVLKIATIDINLAALQAVRVSLDAAEHHRHQNFEIAGCDSAFYCEYADISSKYNKIDEELHASQLHQRAMGAMRELEKKCLAQSGKDGYEQIDSVDAFKNLECVIKSAIETTLDFCA